jgi:multidrug resistance efflux pump
MKTTLKSGEKKPKDLFQTNRPVYYPGHTMDHLPIKERYYSFTLIHSQRFARTMAIALLVIFGGILGLAFVPWQQNLQANGYITALNPEERPQVITTAIGGMIEKWYVKEGQAVKKGDTLLKITETKDKYFDPQTVNRLGQQVEAKSQAVQNIKAKIEALDRQITALQDGLTLGVQKAKNKVLQAQYKVRVDSADLAAARTDYAIAQERFNRNQILFNKQLISQNALESFRLKLQETQAKFTSAENKLAVAQNELINSRLELNAVEAEYLSKIAKARSDRNEAAYGLNDAQAALVKLENERASTSIRTDNYIIRAPQDGFIVKAIKTGIGEYVKAGEGVITIMPRKHTMAVEMYFSPTDVALLEKGREVRLQFDGWPALQFSGWPQVSLGTFGGKIYNIDYVNSTKGKYRVLVVPSDNPKDEPWPRQLRIGLGVYGWAMLDTVSLWYELWRQLNGFPPSLQQPIELEHHKKGEKGEEDKDEE